MSFPSEVPVPHIGHLEIKGIFPLQPKIMEALLSFHILECYSLLVVQRPHTPPATYRTDCISGHGESPRLQIWLDGYIGGPLLCDIRAQLAVTGWKKKKAKTLIFSSYFPQQITEKKPGPNDFFHSHLLALLPPPPTLEHVPMPVTSPEAHTLWHTPSLEQIPFPFLLLIF